MEKLVFSIFEFMNLMIKEQIVSVVFIVKWTGSKSGTGEFLWDIEIWSERWCWDNNCYTWLDWEWNDQRQVHGRRRCRNAMEGRERGKATALCLGKSSNDGDNGWFFRLSGAGKRKCGWGVCKADRVGGMSGQFIREVSELVWHIPAIQDVCTQRPELDIQDAAFLQRYEEDLPCRDRNAGLWRWWEASFGEHISDKKTISPSR